MYDNNYPNTNPESQNDNNPAQNQDQNQGRIANRTQNQNGYEGSGSAGYYQNVYRDSAYTQVMTGNPYDNRSGYYNRANGAGSTAGTHGSGSYQYGNTYPNDYTQAGQNDYTQGSKTAKQKKADKKPPRVGFLKKALISVSLGLLFGVCAGLGLYAVQSLTGMSIQSSAEKDADGVEAMTDKITDTAEGIMDETAKGTAESESSIHVTDSLSTIVADVSEVVKEVMPAIVSINNHYTEKMSFFGQNIVNEADSSGSGIIVGQNDAELLIVTNYHVIADTEKLTVQFLEGSEAEASVKGTDADMDLAVIAVPISNVDSKTMQEIAVATLGDSDSLVVGEPAIAIGNSLGYGQSVTTGVISALNRSIELSDGESGTFIQTDAAINPGNSGGALLNMKGEVIGINSNKIGGSAVEGMGYAIPISSASPIIAELMLKETKNKVAEDERGYLGISGIDVTEYVAETYGMPEGVYISQVYENTAAAAAGLRKGDIITEFDGEEIGSMDELQKELEFHAKGETVEITVLSVGVNGYTSKTVQITLGNKVQN